MADSTDAGYRGQVVSLAGVKGRPGLGTKTKEAILVLVALVEELALEANPGRVWALITNDSPYDVLFDFGTGKNLHTLRPYGNLLINKNLPWTGQVEVYCVTTFTGNQTLSVTECELAGQE